MVENGQDFQIQLIDSYSQDEWIVGHFTGTTWAALNANTLYNLSGLPAPLTLHARIYPNPAQTVNPAHDYELMMGARIASSCRVNVGSDENLVRASSSPMFLTRASAHPLQVTTAGTPDLVL